MKLSLMLEADSINVRALNMGRIVVDVDGVNLTKLINKVAENGYSLRVVEESDQQSTCTLPPFATLAGIRCSTAHITEKDNAWLYSLSHQTNDFGESEWIHFTGIRRATVHGGDQRERIAFLVVGTRQFLRVLKTKRHFFNRTQATRSF